MRLTSRAGGKAAVVPRRVLSPPPRPAAPRRKPHSPPGGLAARGPLCWSGVFSDLGWEAEPCPCLPLSAVAPPPRTPRSAFSLGRSVVSRAGWKGGSSPSHMFGFLLGWEISSCPLELLEFSAFLVFFEMRLGGRKFLKDVQILKAGAVSFRV